MKNFISLSLVTISSLYAQTVELESIDVESTYITEVAQNAKTSADLSNAISENVASVEMSRRSAIANDIFIRGQKRDNISVVVDGTKVCGACPNRMDPPVSHILASQIESLEVIEGPYDVENFGVLSGGVKVTTKTPSQKTHGEVNFGAGSFGYNKIGATVSGGNDRYQLLISASNENSGQYKDGNGDTMSEQITVDSVKFQDKYKDMDAYTKRSLMAKLYVNTLRDQQLRLSTTLNRSSKVLYANSKMDANYDDSNIYSIAYDINNITPQFKQVTLEYYKSDVEHPMGTDFRVSSLTTPIMTHTLTTDMQGLKLKNSFDIQNYRLEVGLDASRRNWDGSYLVGGVIMPDPTLTKKSMNNVTTDNRALFLKLSKRYEKFSYSLGARYDDTSITTDDTTMQNNDYSALGANMMASLHLTQEDRLFMGVGHASRVPDARELYFKQNGKKPNGTKFIKITGTPNLDQVTNDEIDLGYEANHDNFTLKIKTFYSKLSNYIYYEKNHTANNFVNLDATLYGAEVSGSYFLSDDITLDISSAYKVGKKDDVATGEDEDLADIAPLRTTLALNYEYANNSIATIKLKNSQKWTDIDSVNGEQELDGYNVVDFKVKHAVDKNFDITFGVNNIFDTTYAVSNTYADLILITEPTDTMLMNEMGRYIYTNLDFKF